VGSRRVDVDMDVAARLNIPHHRRARQIGSSVGQALKHEKWQQI